MTSSELSLTSFVLLWPGIEARSGGYRSARAAAEWLEIASEAAEKLSFTARSRISAAVTQTEISVGAVAKV